MSFSLDRRGFLLGATGAAATVATGRYLAEPAPVAAPSTYAPTWSSADQHPPSPEWFQDAKFGIYHHRGAFSVPASDSEWYPRNMYVSGSAANKHHIARRALTFAGAIPAPH